MCTLVFDTEHISPGVMCAATKKGLLVSPHPGLLVPSLSMCQLQRLCLLTTNTVKTAYRDFTERENTTKTTSWYRMLMLKHIT